MGKRALSGVLKGLSSAVGVLALSACVTTPNMLEFPVPSIEEPHAILVFRQTEAIAPGSLALGVGAGYTPDVSQQNGIPVGINKALLGGSRREEHEVRVGSGNALFLHLMTTLHVGVCRNFVTFTPLAGHRYLIEQPYSAGSGCRVRIRDMATGETPAGARYYRPLNLPNAPTSEAALAN